MNLEASTQKQLNDVELCTRALLIAMQKAKLQNEPLMESLRALENELAEYRRERFDSMNSEYKSY